MLQKSGRLVLWEAMFILELHSAETQAAYVQIAHALQARAAIAQRHLIQKEKHQRIRA